MFKNIKHAFFLVKLLEDYKYTGPRQFDAHAMRTSDYEDVKSFAKGCMRTYMILKEKAARWNADPEIQALLQGIREAGKGAPGLSAYSPRHRDALLGEKFDRVALAEKGLAYERLDQLTVDLLLGVR